MEGKRFYFRRFGTEITESQKSSNIQWRLLAYTLQTPEIPNQTRQRTPTSAIVSAFWRSGARIAQTIGLVEEDKTN